MQMPRAWKWLAGTAAAGCLAAGGLSFAFPQRYVSSAVIRVTPVEPGSYSPERTRRLTDDILGRVSLWEMVQKLDLYPKERSRMPMEDIVQDMRTRALRIERVEGGSDRGTGAAFRISFEYPDRAKAQAVVSALTAKFVEQNASVDRRRASMWQEVWHEPMPARESEVLEVAAAPRIAEKRVGPNRWVFAAWGLGVGLALGMLVVLGVGGVAAWTAAGFVLGFVAAVMLMLHVTYWFTSTAVMYVAPAENPERWRAQAPAELRITPERVEKIKREILKIESLEPMIQWLDLYREQRAKPGMEQVIEGMRRDLKIRFVQAPPGEGMRPERLAISFTYIDKYKAQALVRQVANEFTERNFQDARAAAKCCCRSAEFAAMAERKMGESVLVLEPASLPEADQTPMPLKGVIVGGTLAGLAMGIWGKRRRAPGVAGAGESAGRPGGTGAGDVEEAPGGLT